jgi:signal peptidase II
MNKNSKYLILAVVSALIVSVDQVTKVYIHTHFQLGEMVQVIQNFFNITYVRNTGAAWGILRDTPDTFRNLFFLSMPPIAMIFIFGILRNLPDSDRLQILALSMIFGGAIGNYIDRLRFGYVIDFLDFHWKNFYTYPAFNVADSAIVSGVTILILIMLRQYVEEQKTAKHKA